MQLINYNGFDQTEGCLDLDQTRTVQYISNGFMYAWVELEGQCS